MTDIILTEKQKAEQGAIELTRQKVRRRFAAVALGMICGITVVVFGFLMLSPERSAITSALSGASSLLTMLLGVFATIIISYIGADAVEKIFGKKE